MSKPITGRPELYGKAAMANGSGKAITDSAVEAAKAGQFLWDGATRGVSGLGLRVNAKGSRTWIFRYRNEEGRQRFFKIGRYPNMNTMGARKAATKLADQIVEQRDPQGEKCEATQERKIASTVADLAAYYLNDYAKSAALRPNTIAMNRAAVNNHINPELGKLPVSQVTKSQIRSLHGKVRADGIAAGNKGAYQANRVLAVLSKMFSLAVAEMELRAANPCKGIKKFPEDRRWRNLGGDEVGRLLRACDAYEEGVRPTSDRDTPDDKARKRCSLPADQRSSTDREAANAIRLLLFTGSRLREVLGAEWSQFDLAGGVWEKPSAHTKTHLLHRLDLHKKHWDCCGKWPR